MVLLREVRAALIDVLRRKVRNGELTERGLAKLVGVSQPHMHNLLKGVRVLSLDVTDQIMGTLQISLLDLVSPDALERRLGGPSTDGGGHCFYLPVLQGSIGPHDPWPARVETRERFPVVGVRAEFMVHPVVVRLGADDDMASLYGAGDCLLLDQSLRARSEIDPDGYYVVKRGAVGLVRRLRLSGNTLFIGTAPAAGREAKWEALPLGEYSITFWVRARGWFMGRHVEWEDTQPGTDTSL